MCRRRSQHRIWLVAGVPASCQMLFAGRSPYPLLRHKVRCACNALRERAFHAPLPCSSVPNKTRFAGLLFGRGKRKIQRKDEKRQTIQHSNFNTGFRDNPPKSSTSPYEPERLCDRVLSRKMYRHSRWTERSPAAAKAIGNNLNQLAVLANMGKVQFANLDTAAQEFAKINTALRKLQEGGVAKSQSSIS